MKIFSSYIEGLKIAGKYKGITFLVYFLILAFGLLIVFPLRNQIGATIANSMLPYNLLEGFNYTSIREFLNQYPSFTSLFRNQVLWFGIAFVFISILLSSGIVLTIYRKNEQSYIKTYFSYCAEYFGPFLRLAIISLSLHIIIIFFTYSAVGMVLSDRMDGILSFREIVFIVGAGILVHLLFATFILIVTDYSKMIIVTNESKKALISFWKSVLFSTKNIFHTFSLYLILQLFPLVLITAYLFIDDRINMSSPRNILIIFFIQQIFIWFRLFNKFWILSSQFAFYNENTKPDEAVSKTILVAENEEWDLKSLNESGN